MIDHFPQIKQKSINGCPPTAVYSVLLWHEHQVSADDISEWCGEEADGCLLDLAINGLRDRGFDVEEIVATSELEARELLYSLVIDTDDPQPVIVTLQNIFLNADGDHAVVVTNVRQEPDNGVEREIVEFMDPAAGTMVQDESRRFWRNWSFAGRRGFVIRP